MSRSESKVFLIEDMLWSFSTTAGAMEQRLYGFAPILFGFLQEKLDGASMKVMQYMVLLTVSRYYSDGWLDG